MRTALMWVCKRGTRSLVGSGNIWKDDYHVDTFCVEETEFEALKRSWEVTRGLWWIAPFNETRFAIPERVQMRIRQLGLHVL